MVALVPGAATADVPGLRAYLAARSADPDTGGARAFARAFAAAPTDPLIAVRTYRAAVRAGDLALAERAADVLRRAGVAPADAALLPLARAARAGDRAAVEKATNHLSGTTLAILMPALRVWTAKDARRELAPGGDLGARRLATEARSLRLLADGHIDDGMDLIRAQGGVAAPLDLRVAAIQALMARGKRDEARTLVDEDDPVLAALVASDDRPDLAPGFGVSRLLGRVASDLAVDGPSPLVETLTRAALLAEPRNGRAALVLADALSRSNAPDLALAALSTIRSDDPFAATARAASVEVLIRGGRTDEALATAKRLADRPGAGAADWQRLAQLHGQANRWGEAVTLYARVAASPEGRGDWAAWMQYGEALERSGDWPRAREALARAVAIAPEEPLALNYLGYASAEHGEPIGEAQRLLERASRLRPDDTSIADSLGWAYHLGGDTGRALPLIERAAADQPDNAEIAEHLGDAYWAAGRRYEARYAWRAASVLSGADVPARLARKLEQGAMIAR